MFSTSSTAGEFNPVLSIGDPAPLWKQLPGVDGRQHSLEDLKDKRLIVVVFTCNSCPVAVEYEDRIIEFARRVAGPDSKVAVVAINANTVEEDRLPKMKQRSKDKEFPFAYLFDESQQVAKAYGATFTPEFFVIDRERKIAYMGAMDDHADPSRVKTKHLDEAVTALLTGRRPETKETVARGCLVRYKKKRRRRKKKKAAAQD